MNSIRPLATITVLTFVGAYLYMKITETEATLPEGVDTWAIEQDIQIDDGFGAVGGIQAPSFTTSPTPATDAASRNQTTGAAPAFSGPAGTAPAATAPAWNSQATPPPTTEPSLQAADTNASSPADQVAAASPADSLNLPPLPAIPQFHDNSSSPDRGYPAQATPPQRTSENNAPTAVLPSPTTPADLSAAAVQSPTGPTMGTATQTSLFAASRLAVQAALDRGELAQALLLLSDWYGDPSLTQSETQEVQALLSQLAGSVIYSTEPRLEPPYLVQAGETLSDVAEKYDVPWQLLAKINGISHPDQVAAGQQLKVLRGPFSAVLDLNKRRLTLMLDRRYAGQFAIEFDPSLSVEAGQWTVNQKLLSPAAASYPRTSAAGSTEERSLTLSNAAGETSQLAILCSATPTAPRAEPVHRMIRLQPTDVADVFDILSLGSKVVVRR